MVQSVQSHMWTCFPIANSACIKNVEYIFKKRALGKPNLGLNPTSFLSEVFDAIKCYNVIETKCIDYFFKRLSSW